MSGDAEKRAAAGATAEVAAHFSHRVEVSDPNPVIAAQRLAKAQGQTLYQLNDSNPTHHHLAPTGLPSRYDADPHGQYEARTALASFLSARVEGADAEIEAQGRPADVVVESCAVEAAAGTGVTTDAHTASGAAATSASAAVTFGNVAAGEPVSADDLYLASSTSEAYSWLMKLLCDPGDAVLCPTPGYPLIESIGRLEGVEAMAYPLLYDGSWTIDVGAVERALAGEQGARIHAIILINPNNPTGSYVSQVDYERIVALCRTYGVALIADEVFFDFPLLPLDPPHRVAGEKRVLTFGLDGFSKMLAAPHAKVGWIQVSGPESDVAAAKRRLDVITDDFLPMSGIIAERIPSMLKQVPAQLLRLRERTRTNLVALETQLALSASGVVSLLHPEGGWNVLLRFPSVIDENELVETLIREHHVTAQPGYFFDMASNGYVAVSLLPEPEDFKRGITVLLDTVDTLLV